MEAKRPPQLKTPSDLKDPKFSENSLAIMEKRHLMKSSKGKVIEKPKDMFWRVAYTIASEDAKYVKGTEPKKASTVGKSAHEFYELMSTNKFLPGSRVLYEAGNYIDGTGQLSSCFVLPVEDSLDSIFETMKEAAIVQKNNGGTGFNFSHVRPKGDVVGGTPNVAAGPIHFIRSYSQAFDQVLQGKKRGGGNMAILNVDHPDIIEFINLKGKDSSIRNFNISVGVTDAFMAAVKNDEEYDLINPRTGRAVKRLRARDVFELICTKAWECADPGLFFLDTTQNANPTKPYGIIEATNPCGEEPLRAYESCNLGSVVLPSHLSKKGKTYEVNWEELKRSVHSAIHFLENMIDSSKFPLAKIQKEVSATRKLGLGVVGLGSMFYRMKISYNSEEATNLTKQIIDFIEEESINESESLATVRGVFPAYKGSKWEKMKRKVRNATMTSIAPTGTLSLVADCSSGIEPIFSLVYQRNYSYQDEGKEERKQLFYVDKDFEEFARTKGFYSDKLMAEIAANGGSLHGLSGVPEEAKKIFVVTHDIEPDWHVKMQAAAQNSVDAAVSKTINLSNSATVEDIRKAYVLAWETGCKGITIYRDGSKQMQVLESVASKASEADLKQDYKLTNNALQVLEKRALLKDANGKVTETPDQLWQRIAKHIASVEKANVRDRVTKEFVEVMANAEFLCGGTLLWAGMGEDTLMSKCLVLPVDDSIDSIFQTLNWNIQCLRRGVGTGFNFSKIRSTFSKVKTTGEFAAGPVEYLRMYNRAQDTIRGRGGRGLGSMAILNADHPNVEDFISCKDNLVDITHYNISVGASDDFMKAVKNSADWQLKDPHDKVVYKTIKARDLFEKIAQHAWQSGDPGLYFLDHAEKGNTTPELGTMMATNPCGEQPLLPFETCNMGHINVSVIVDDFPFARNPELYKQSLDEKLKFVNWDKLTRITKVGIRFLDNMIDVNRYPIKEIEEMTKSTRNIGIGVMGFADMLIKLGIAYGSKDSLLLAEKVMQHIQTVAHQTSEELAKEKGNFPAFKKSIWAKQKKKFMRNTRVTTIAPTGTISIIANCNPGIEPAFALGYRRKNSMGGTDQEVIEHSFESLAKIRGFYSEELIHKIADGAHLHDLASEFAIPEDVVDVFKTAHEIDPENHVHIQAAFQKYVDSAVSKTINLPSTATWQDIARVYMLAYDLGCKGITIFRDGSKDPALQVGTKNKAAQTTNDTSNAYWANKYAELKASIESLPKNAPEMPRNSLDPRKRSNVVKGFTYEVKTEQGSLFITINEDELGLVELFMNLGKSGSYTAGYTEAIGRLISMALRSGIKPEAIINQLQGIRTSTPTLNKGMFIYSVPDAVAKILKQHLEQRKNQITMFQSDASPSVTEPVAAAIENKQEVAVEEKPVIKVEAEPVVKSTVPAVSEEKSKYTKNNSSGDMLECPDCGGDLEYAEGCILCRSCGFSKCG